MIVAVNRDLRGLPTVKDSALAELARSLARRVDDGELRAVGELRRTLVELQRLATPKPPARSRNVKSDDIDAGQEVAAHDDDVLTAIEADRAARRDDLARRRARRAGAADHDGSGARSRTAGDGG